MGCKLSVHVATPPEESWQQEIAALHKTIAALQAVVEQQQQQQQVEGDQPPSLVPSARNVTQLMMVEAPLGLATNETRDNDDDKAAAVEQCKEVAPPPPRPVVTVSPPQPPVPAVETPTHAEPPSSGDFLVRVPLKPTEIVTHLLQATHQAEMNALEYMLTSQQQQQDGNHAEAAATWREYQTFRRRYDFLLHGNKRKDDNEEAKPEEGGLLHFLGLPADLDDNASETVNIQAIDENLDWRVDTSEALARYQEARLAHIDRVEDAVLPRLDALQQAAAQPDETNHENDDTTDVDLDEMTKSVLFVHVLNPFCAEGLEFFVRYVTRALERKGPNKSAIRPFQNALKAMAQTAEQAELYKSWITHTRKTGILAEQAQEKLTASSPTTVLDTVPEQAPEEPVAVASSKVTEKAKEVTPADTTVITTKEEPTTATKEEPVVQEQAPTKAAF